MTLLFHSQPITIIQPHIYATTFLSNSQPSRATISLRNDTVIPQPANYDHLTTYLRNDTVIPQPANYDHLTTYLHNDTFI